MCEEKEEARTKIDRLIGVLERIADRLDAAPLSEDDTDMHLLAAIAKRNGWQIDVIESGGSEHMPFPSQVSFSRYYQAKAAT